MKINLKQTINNYEGQPLINEDGKSQILRDYFITALNGQLAQEVLTAEQKAKIYQLSTKMYAGSEIDLTIDDRAFIKERVGLIYNPLVYGRICEVLEGDKSSTPQLNKSAIMGA